jgi:hypothetical protein
MFLQGARSHIFSVSVQEGLQLEIGNDVPIMTILSCRDIKKKN